jgi:hypothetical protein
MDKKIICWWSGGITSAVACKLAMDIFTPDVCDLVFIDTKNEDEDTYRFKDDCELWYGKQIKSISRNDVNDIRDVWYKYNSLNVAKGAICSTVLKREVREKYQKENPNFLYQVFGFDIDEPKRAKAMTKNYSGIRPIYPLLFFGYDKKQCIDIVLSQGIRVPRSYEWGFNNNNCLGTGCVQGGIGYWQKISVDRPDLFDNMAKVEHELTDRKGSPVTMLKDQSKDGGLVFLKPHPNYPDIKDISMMKGRRPKPLMECNGFCGVNDLDKNETENEINYE